MNRLFCFLTIFFISGMSGCTRSPDLMSQISKTPLPNGHPLYECENKGGGAGFLDTTPNCSDLGKPKASQPFGYVLTTMDRSHSGLYQCLSPTRGVYVSNQSSCASAQDSLLRFLGSVAAH